MRLRACRLRPSEMPISNHAVGMALRSRIGGNRGHRPGSADSMRTLRRPQRRQIQAWKACPQIKSVSQRHHFAIPRERSPANSRPPASLALHLAGAVIPSLSITPAHSRATASSVGVPSTCAR